MTKASKLDKFKAYLRELCNGVLIAKTRLQQAGEGTTTNWFSATKLGSVSACWDRTSVPTQQQGPRWYREEYVGTRGPLLCRVNTSPNAHRSEVLEVSVNLGVHTFCQNEVLRLCRWLCFAVKEERDPTRGHHRCGRCLPPACPVLWPGCTEAGNGLPWAGGGGTE